jgi:hypothetical protein
VTEHRYLPEANRLSVLTAMILLAYAIARLADFPLYKLELQALNRDLVFNVNLNILVAFLVAILTATGMDWLLRGHPAFHGRSIEHWLLPTLTAWTLSIPLITLQHSAAWWPVFGLGGALMVLVFVAEYIVVDSNDARYALASAGLIALAFGLFLILTVTIRFTGARLFLQIPVFVVAGFLVTVRVLQLRTGAWQFNWAIGLSLMTAQVATGWHYWPLTPFQFALVLFAPLYAVTGLAINLMDKISMSRALIEMGAIIGAFTVLAFLIR